MAKRQRVWYYFSVENAAIGQSVILNIINMSKTKTLYREGASPVVRSKNSDWQKVDKDIDKIKGSSGKCTLLSFSSTWE